MSCLVLVSYVFGLVHMSYGRETCQPEMSPVDMTQLLLSGNSSRRPSPRQQMLLSGSRCRHGAEAEISDEDDAGDESGRGSSMRREPLGKRCCYCNGQLYSDDTLYRGLNAHVTCAHDNKAKDRLVAKSKDPKQMRESVKKMKAHNPDAYSELLFFLKQRDSGGKRGQGQLMGALEFMEEFTREVCLTRRHGVVMLPKHAFIARHRFVEGLSKRQSKEKWAADKANSKVDRCVENGKLCLAVRKHTEINLDANVKSKQNSQSEKMMVSRSAAESVLAGQGPSLEASGVRALNVGRRSLQNMSLPHTAARATEACPSSDGDDADEKDGSSIGDEVSDDANKAEPADEISSGESDVPAPQPVKRKRVTTPPAKKLLDTPSSVKRQAKPLAAADTPTPKTTKPSPESITKAAPPSEALMEVPPGSRHKPDFFWDVIRSFASTLRLKADTFTVNWLHLQNTFFGLFF